jgi:AAA15 family ATPase/GTPase
MENHFIKNVEFENFKCFEKLKVKKLKRVTLIGGKNNIGKTSFLEGLELFLSSKNSYNLAMNIYKMIRRRQGNISRERYFELDFIYSNNSKVDLIIDDNKIEIEYLEEVPNKVDEFVREENIFMKYEPSLKLTVNEESFIVPIERISDRPLMIRRELDSKLSINFISSSTAEEKEIAIYYGRLIDINMEKFLDESLSLFDENIIALKQKMTDRDVVLKLQLKNRETPVLLSSLGEGINRYIAILCAIWSSKNGYLFIDEIENGIHYTNYEKLWRIIFEASEKANCQVFVTSHSKECIEAFNRVNEEDEGIYLELYKNQKNGLIEAQDIDYKQLSYELTHGGEVRGE